MRLGIELYRLHIYTGWTLAPWFLLKQRPWFWLRPKARFSWEKKHKGFYIKGLGFSFTITWESRYPSYKGIHVYIGV
jgi:hypothetical protein